MAAIRAELPLKLLPPLAAAAPPSAPALLPPERIVVLTMVPILAPLLRPSYEVE